MNNGLISRSTALIGASVTLAAPVLAQGWAADVSTAALPAGPAAGKINGKKFVPDKVELQMSSGKGRTTYFLNFRTGKEFFADSEYKLTLLTRPGEKLAGKKFVVGPGGTFEMEGAIKDGEVSYPPLQGVMMTWTVPGKTFGDTDMGSKYTMRLEFGPAKGGRQSGAIYLAMQDAKKSFVAGRFSAVVKKL